MSEERLALLMDIKRKGVKFCEIAEKLNVSNAWITNYFGKKQVHFSEQHEEQMKQFVEQYSK